MEYILFSEFYSHLVSCTSLGSNDVAKKLIINRRSALPLRSTVRLCNKTAYHASDSLQNPPLSLPNLLATTKPKFPIRRRFITSMASESKECPSNNPGLHASPDHATNSYIMQQTMFRIKDPKVSLDFYSRVLGMSLLKRLDFPEMKFSLYFMGYEDPTSAPSNAADRTVWTFSKKATVELTHNWGTETDSDFKGYHNGNSDPRGFGHIGITVDDTYKACERFERLGVEFVKKPDDGKMKGIAFIKDPDGYWIEIFDLKTIKSATGGAV